MEKSESFRIAPNRRFWPIKYRREPFRCGSVYAKEPHNAQATASMPAEEPIEKLELPLADDAEIHRLVNQFEQCTLPYKHWTHRAHLAVATLYLQQFSFDDALTRIRKTIRSYNRQCGDPDGYNETITIMYMKKIAAESTQDKPPISMHNQVKLLQRYCTVDWLYNYYLPELIWSDRAKAGWVDPDVAELDF